MFDKLKSLFAAKKSVGTISSLPLPMQDPEFKPALKFDRNAVTLIVKGKPADYLPTISEFCTKHGLSVTYTDTMWVTDGQVELGFALLMICRYNDLKEYDMMRHAYRLGQIMTTESSQGFLYMIQEANPIDIIANVKKTAAIDKQG